MGELMPFTQEAHSIAITTPLGKDVLLLRGFSGSEAISQLFHFDLDLLSENDSIKFQDVVGKNVTLHVNTAEGPRHFNGFISRFSQGSQDRRLTAYHAQMVPWLWFLTRTADCRIFQNQKVPDIIQKIFTDLKFQDFELRLYGSYTPREYCVQYRETDFNFVSRLMEEEGICYFFDHQDGKHVLVLADDPAAHKPCPNQETARYGFSGPGGTYNEDMVTEWHYDEEFRPGTWAQTDYNFETPSTSLAVTVNGKNPYEIYEFPGEHYVRAQGDRLAKIRLQEQTAPTEVSHGSSMCRNFRSGFQFKLEDHYRNDLNEKYLITVVRHTATHGGNYEAGAPSGGDLTYCNSFECIPSTTPFRPPRVTPTPFVQGCQTAKVVGPAGEEIYTDKHGRVKVQFHWDREGKHDENSSCWIRVSHPWAGQGWGAVSIPRIGQEVIVDFLEGDPDQPIITGRVYNAEQMPPFGMPAGAVVSGIKSNSTKGGGGSNEISLNDTKGKEMITVHAQYDMATTVEHDDTQTVHNNRAIQVDGTHDEKIVKDTNITITTGAYKLDVQANTHTHHVSGKVLEVYESEQDTVVTNRIVTVSKTAQIIIDAKTEIILHCGSSLLSMKQDGTIVLSGVKISVEGTQEVKSGVSTQTVTCDTSQVTTSGAGITSTAVGVHNIKGALVKIN
jgi:type VI secretion system secreted protein VgrG